MHSIPSQSCQAVCRKSLESFQKELRVKKAAVCTSCFLPSTIHYVSPDFFFNTFHFQPLKNNQRLRGLSGFPQSLRLGGSHFEGCISNVFVQRCVCSCWERPADTENLSPWLHAALICRLSKHLLWHDLLLFSCSVMSDSLWPHGLQHARLPCPSLSPRVCSNSCPLSWWCHPTISSSVTRFSSCPQSFPTSGSFPVNWFFESDGQSIGASASASVLPMNI